MIARVSSGELLEGRYRLEHAIGTGGMGEVWSGTDLQLGRSVAIKVLLPHVMSRPDAIARFEREARVGAALGHTNVVHTLDFGIHEGRRFLVMQLVVGGSLLDYRLANRPLPVGKVVAFGYQIAAALAAAHDIGLVHRDLKPENVLVDRVARDLILRVADFGMAYLMSPLDARQGRLTTDGGFGGTPEYMAPEQIAGGAAGPPADIYALGCLIFELATDTTPFFGAGVGKIFASHLYAPPPRIRELRPEAPAALDELVLRMLAKTPTDRPTAEIVLRRLATLEPTELNATSRSRHAGVLSDRASRMVTSPPPLVGTPELASGRVEVLGELDSDLLIAMTAAGLTASSGSGVDVRVVLGADLEAVARACADGVPVVADAKRGDFHRISSLLRLGVAEVVFTPLIPANLVRKLLRAIRKRSEPAPPP